MSATIFKIPPISPPALNATESIMYYKRIICSIAKHIGSVLPCQQYAEWLEDVTNNIIKLPTRSQFLIQM